MDQREKGEIDTPRHVVDAGVIAKWVLRGESHQESAVRPKDDFVSGLVELCARGFIVEEVANALWRASTARNC